MIVINQTPQISGWQRKHTGSAVEQVELDLNHSLVDHHRTHIADT